MVVAVTGEPAGSAVEPVMTGVGLVIPVHRLLLAILKTPVHLHAVNF